MAVFADLGKRIDHCLAVLLEDAIYWQGRGVVATSNQNSKPGKSPRCARYA